MRAGSLEAELDTYKRGAAPTTTPSSGTPYSPFPPPAQPTRAAESHAYTALQDSQALDSSLGGTSFPHHAQQQHAFSRTPAAAEYSQYPTQQLPVDAPYLFHSDAHLPLHQSPQGNGHAPLSAGFAQQSPHANGASSSFSHRDSEAFPLPPRVNEPSYLPQQQPQSALTGSPHPPVQAHLQSFPFAMNPTPQLSDLINPPSATSMPQYSPGAAASPVPGSAARLSAGYGDAAVAPAWGTELPALELMLELAELYFSTLHVHLPFLHCRRFLYTLHHPASLSSPPSQSLIFAVLAISAAYHDSPAVRAQGAAWYSLARDKVDAAINAGSHSHHSPAGAGAANGGRGRTATFTVEMVQALCLLSLVEMGVSDHQRAFLSMGQAVRIAAMLGLHRMDEDRVADRTGVMREKRLRPPALHPLPTDPVLLEECRRTMCTVYVLDRFESATVGWPAAIAEGDVRVLLPCADELFEQGTCDADGRDNPLWWPADEMGTSRAAGWQGIMVEAEAAKAATSAATAGASEGDGGSAGGAGAAGEPESIGGGGGAGSERVPAVGTFAWLCRVVWLGGRIQSETYRASGPPAGGPWNKHIDLDPLDSPSDSLEMDNVIEYVRNEFVAKAARKAQQGKGVDGPMLMILLFLNWCVLLLSSPRSFLLVLSFAETDPASTSRSQHVDEPVPPARGVGPVALPLGPARHDLRRLERVRHEAVLGRHPLDARDLVAARGVRERPHELAPQQSVDLYGVCPLCVGSFPLALPSRLSSDLLTLLHVRRRPLRYRLPRQICHRRLDPPRCVALSLLCLFSSKQT